MCFSPLFSFYTILVQKNFLAQLGGLVLIDQRRVDVLCDHDQKVPPKEKCLCVTSHSYLGNVTYVLYMLYLHSSGYTQSTCSQGGGPCEGDETLEEDHD